MKKLIIVLAFIITASLSKAQGTLAPGANQLNVGLGLSGWGIPVYVGFDHGFKSNVTLGGELSFRAFSDKVSGVSYRHSIVGLSGNGNYHFNEILDIDPEWDVYAGLNVGFYFWSSSKSYTGDGSSGLGLGAQVGGRYFFNSSTAINLEFGGGNSFSGGKIGITKKF
jgi:outer membrane immunogenic protein